VLLCAKPLSDEQHLVNPVYSMMPLAQIISYLYKTETGKNGVGNKREREGERTREAD
jgi:hypothetical protein